MKQSIIVISVLILNSFLIQSCESKKEESQIIYSEAQIQESGPTEIEIPTQKDIIYSIKVEQIDSLKFQSAKKKANPKPEKIVKITDFNEAKKKLKGIVEFNDDDEDGESHLVMKINFRNGKVYGKPNEYDYNYFVAYYPKEDILLCEGGHTTHVSFNLKTGKETNDTGNPEYISTSPKKGFRLNGWYGGQECSSYFIQKKVQNEYQKVLELDEAFQEITGIWLCIVGQSFWSDEKTLYLSEESDFSEAGLNKRYFKIELI